MEALSSLVEKEQLNLFVQPRWVANYNGSMQVLGVYHKGDEPKALFTMYSGSKLGAAFGITGPLSPHCGLVLLDRTKKLSSSQTFEKNVHAAISEYLIARNDSVVDINMPSWIKDTQSYVWKEFSVTPRYTYILDILTSSDDLKAGLSASKRQNLNKGVKDELVVEKTDDKNLIYSVIKKTFDVKKEAFHEDVLLNILDSESLKDSRYAYVVKVNNQPSACVLIVHDQKTAYYLLGGYDRSNSHEGSGTLAMWHAITEAQERGLREFDFLGSMIPEVEKYIRGFGGELTPFFSISKKSVLAEVFMKITGRA
jgi:hypothetical protein